MSASSSSDPRIGTLVADRYRLSAKLGEGGMGAVYRGLHEALRKPVAVKFLVPAARADKELVARFEREAVATANLKHPNISETTDYGQLPDGTLFLVMEYIEGKNLRELASGARLSPARVLGIVKQIGLALSFAHSADIVHRDLKPDNVIVYDRGTERDLVKVIDFGIARITTAFGLDKRDLTQEGSVFGTPDYMAPEQAMGQAVDARADQYALGAIAFELFTGKPPYVADTEGSLMMMHVGAPIPRVTELAPEVPAPVADVVEKMMGKLPDERFASVDEAVTAMVRALDAPAPAPTHAPPTATARSAPTMPIPRATAFPVRWIAAAAGAFVVLIVAAILLVVVVRHFRGGSQADASAALALWKSGKYAEGASALRAVLEANPGLEEDAEVASVLSSSVDNQEAEKHVDDLMKKTALGRSTTMAGALGDAAITGGTARRDAALNLLRDRHEKLTPERRYRVELRDADDCNALAGATSSLTALGSGAASEDVAGVRSGSCKGMLRRNKLCDECRGKVGATNNPASTAAGTADKGSGKSKGKGHGR